MAFKVQHLSQASWQSPSTMDCGPLTAGKLIAMAILGAKILSSGCVSAISCNLSR